MDRGIHLPIINLKIQDSRYSNYFPFYNWKINAFSFNEQRMQTPEVKILFSSGEPLELSHHREIISSYKNTFSGQVHALEDSCFLFSLVDCVKKRIWLQYILDYYKNSITLLVDNTDTAGVAAFEYLVTMMPGFLIGADSLMFHGALMEVDDFGIIISAPSETGKTTHVHLWRDFRNALIINGDISTVYLKQENGSSTWTGYGIPWCGTSGEYMNREVPLKAIVMLEQGESNLAFRLLDADAFGSVSTQLQLPVWDRALCEKGVDLLLKLLIDIPVIRLQCRPDIEAVETLEQALNEL